MKKGLIVLLLIVVITSVVQAKEQKIIEETIKQKCSMQISNYQSNNSIDNAISVSECIYKCQKKYKQNTMENTKNLYKLYATKYSNSANNPQYIDEMYKYAFETIKAGSKDISIIKDFIYLLQIKECNSPYTIDKNIANLDFAFELLAQVSPNDAKKIKQDVINTKNTLQNKKQLMYNKMVDYMNSDEFKDSTTGPVWDQLSGKFMKPSEIKERNDGLLKQGTSYEELLLKKRQNDSLQNSLQNINSSLENINSSLNGLRYGY